MNANDASVSSPNEMATVGIRRCPDPACSALVFFVWKNGQVVDSYPAETIDFDATNVPAAWDDYVATYSLYLEREHGVKMNGKEPGS